MPRTGPVTTAPTAAELERFEGAPLDVWRLAAIWRSLPERERFPFVLALDEAIADQVIRVLCERQQGGSL
jgi:hypothetical protein